MNKKVVFVVAYIVVAFVAYVIFFYYNYSRYKEYVAIQEAEWMARGVSLEFYYGYVHEGFLSAVWGRNVLSVGLALGLVGPLIIMEMFGLLDRKKKP